MLLFKPWRECDTLLGDSSNYVGAFNSLLHGLQYHDQLSRLQEADSTVRELIRERKEEMEKEDMQSTDDVVEGPLRYVANTVTEAMNDFEDLMLHVDPTTIDDMIEKVNSDQTRIFNKVKTIIESQQTVGSSGDAEILRLSVSGCGGTGKSYLIKTIRAWVQTTTGKDVAVAATTGIVSRSINGLTVHGMLALPVEHGSTPSY